MCSYLSVYTSLTCDQSAGSLHFYVLRMTLRASVGVSNGTGISRNYK